VSHELVREIAASRPPNPGPEWWLLLDLAIDADDVTRRTACGFDYMMERTGAPRSTVLRWLKKLREAGLIVTAEKSAGGSAGRKGKRAVYEIQVPPALAARIAAELSRVSQKETRLRQPESTGRVSPVVRPDSVENGSRVSPAVRPPLQDPIGRAPVEGACPRPDQDRSDENKQKPLAGPEREARRALAAQAGPQPRETEAPMRPKQKRRSAA
jgi:DNA-binding transcriptional ArsR family regulator